MAEMTRTPDEIKKGLEALKFVANAGRIDDALALIQQLESDKQQLEGMLAHMNQLRDAAAGRALKMEKRAHQLEAERDAALADFKLYRERNIKGECGVYACDLCKIGGKYEEWEELKCPKGCMGIEHWQWRGVQKEDGNA